MSEAPPDTATTSHQSRVRAGAISVVAGLGLLGVKYYAYLATGSSAILSDAAESIVNVIAAIVALAALVVSSWPADRTHPYGHGKIEFMTAAFEGGLIAFAAVVIVAEAIGSLIRGVEVRSLDLGIALTLGAGIANYALGWFLIRTGERQSSMALIADGRHVQADFWTSVGVVVGLTLVLLTGIPWIDPVCAILVGINLAVTGWRLAREAAGGLLDEEDPALLREIVDAVNDHRMPGIIQLHFLRAIRSGSFRHFDAHLVVPEHWPVERAHDLADDLERRVTQSLNGEAEIAFHLDPCKQSYCDRCDLDPCPIRQRPFVAPSRIPFDEATRPENPTSGQW